MNGMVGNALLQEFGQQIGLEGMIFKDGTCCLSFDDVEVNIEYKVGKAEFLLYADVMQISGRVPDAMLLRLMELNYAFAMLSQGALVLDVDSGKVLLVDHLPIGYLDAAGLSGFVQRMVERAEVLRSTVAMPGFGQPSGSDVPAQLDHFQIIRA